MSVAEKYAAVLARVERAAARAGRDPAEITVVAVTKKFLAPVIEEARQAGIRDVGENYAQEMMAKIDALPDAAELRWHFIGHLQRNKVKQVIGYAHLIHTVDSQRLGAEIDKRARAEGLVQRVLVEVSLAGEASKTGIAPDAAPELIDALGEMDAVRCEGMMAMPPWPEHPEDNRRWFAELRQLRDRLATSEQPLSHLSMGTTGDFEVAIEEGATLIRVGTAIFGPRPGF